jgi:hypothetical protein
MTPYPSARLILHLCLLGATLGSFFVSYEVLTFDTTFKGVVLYGWLSVIFRPTPATPNSGHDPFIIQVALFAQWL